MKPYNLIMEDKIQQIVDSYEDHIQHFTFRKDCSTCYSENRLIKTYKEVNKPEEPIKGFAKRWMNFIIWGDNKHFYD